MSEAPDAAPAPAPSPLSRLDLGILIALITVAIAGVVGLIAVLDADSDAGAIGAGIGLTFLTFQAGATIAVALACLARRRLQIPALIGLVAAGLALDLVAIAIWLDIEDETYAKLAGVAYVWAFFALIVLGLTLAAQPVDALARRLYLGAATAAVLGGVVATVLILDAGDGDIATTGSPIPYAAIGNDLLRPLGALLVVLAALWFATLAATRVDRVDLTR